MIKEHMMNIKKIFKIAFIDLKKVYRGAALGWIWLIIKPATTIFIYWFSFEIGLKVAKEVNGYPYYIWLISGILPWFYMSDMITTGPDAFRKYNYLVTKMKFEISIIPTFLSLSRIIVNIMLTIIVLAMYVLLFGKIDIYFFQLPIYLLLMFISFSLIANIFAMIGSVSKDFSNLIKTLPTVILFLSAIFWDASSINIEWVKSIQKYNLVSYFSTGYRNVFINKVWFFEDLEGYFIVLGFIFILTIVASILYKKMRKEIPDYL